MLNTPAWRRAGSPPNDSPYGPVERMYRDARAMWLEEGAPNVQRITIARNCQKFGGKVEYQL